jgi:hypothetical protein
MAKRGPDLDLSDRLAELDARIRKIRAEVARGMETETVEHIIELGAIVHRHAELQRKAKSLVGPAVKKHESRIVAGLAADLKGVEQSLREWIARLDKTRLP